MAPLKQSSFELEKLSNNSTWDLEPIFDIRNLYGLCSGQNHPWAGEDLSLKIDERDQTIWICILEL